MPARVIANEKMPKALGPCPLVPTRKPIRQMNPSPVPRVTVQVHLPDFQQASRQKGMLRHRHNLAIRHEIPAPLAELQRLRNRFVEELWYAIHLPTRRHSTFMKSLHDCASSDFSPIHVKWQFEMFVYVARV